MSSRKFFFQEFCKKINRKENQMCKQGYSVVSFGNMHIIKYVICGIVILGYARDSGTTEVCIRG